MPSKLVDTAARFVVGPVILASDGKTIATGVAYNDAGADVSLYEETQEGTAKTALTLTTGGAQDWVEIGDGYYYVEVTAAQLDTTGIAWVGGIFTATLPFESVHYDIIDNTDVSHLSTILGASQAAAIAADVASLVTDTTAASNLQRAMTGVVHGLINDASATTTAFATDGFTEATDDHFNGRLIVFITGALLGQMTDITDYDAAGGVQGSQQFTVTALTEAPANNDEFIII